ncbi:hypothetical protein CDAR_433511, partial [Caerostris darwini]
RFGTRTCLDKLPVGKLCIFSLFISDSGFSLMAWSLLFKVFATGRSPGNQCRELQSSSEYPPNLEQPPNVPQST